MDITELLKQDAEPNGDATSNLDLQAAMVVQKLAHQHGQRNGIDFSVDDIPPEQYQELLADAKAKIASAAAEQAQHQGAGGAEEGAKVAVDQREVISEITKRAAATGINIAELSNEEYADVYNTVASQLADPGYQAEIEAHQQKLASAQEAYELGQYMSQGFVDGLNAGTTAEEPEADKTAGAKETVAKGARKADELLQRLGTKAMNVAGAGAEKASPGLKRGAGAAAAGAGAAGAGGAAYAGKKMMESKKTAEAVHARALEIIAEEQAKIAAEEGTLTDEQFEELARQHAIELVQQEA